jgi:cytochrome o ubiquinol oxidase operon protein cyoD
MNRLEPTDTFHGTLAGYALGFGLSLATTLFAFWAAFHLEAYAVPAIVSAAIAQLVVQLFFFLHVKTSPQAWKVTGALFLVIVGIVVVGTLWIMANLARLHHHHEAPNLENLYENGVPAPQNELR